MARAFIPEGSTVGSQEINAALAAIQSSNYIPYTATADIAAGDIVVVGDHAFVADVAIANAATGELRRVGPATVPKTVGTPFSVGKKVYWDESEEVCVWSVSSGNLYMGFNYAAALASASTVSVVLEQ
jgi:predicted RecA/RadA family phage recombinase